MQAPITELLGLMRQGNEFAAHQLVNHFLPILRKQLTKYAKRLKMSDEDDIAVSAFYEFHTAIANSRFQDVLDRTHLWQVLLVIAVRKANDFRKAESAQKRGGNFRVLSLESLSAQVASMEAGPETNLEIIENSNRLIRSLTREDLKKAARLKLCGYTNAEIGTELNVATRTVQLMMVRVRKRALELFAA